MERSAIKKNTLRMPKTWVNLREIMGRGKRPIPKGHLLNDSIYVTFLKMQTTPKQDPMVHFFQGQLFFNLTTNSDLLQREYLK